MKNYIKSRLFITNDLAKKYEKKAIKQGFKTKIRKVKINKNIFNYQVCGKK